jgi:hypothetical protein
LRVVVVVVAVSLMVVAMIEMAVAEVLGGII